MSWLSQALSGDWGGLSNAISTTTPAKFFSDTGADIGKALSNPVVDIGLGLGALGLGAFALPALIPEFGAATAEAAAAATPSLASATEAAGGGALGLAGDVSAADPGLSAFLADPAGAAGGGGLPSDALSLTGPESMGAGGDLTPAQAAAQGVPASGVGGGAPTPSLSSSVAAAGGPGDLGTIGPGGPIPLSPTTMGGAPAAAPGSASLLPSWMQSTGTLGATLKDIGPIAGLGGLGYNMYQGYESKKALEGLAKTEQGLAANAAATAAEEQRMSQPLFSKGEQLMNFLATNKLPHEFEAQVTQNVNAARARAIAGAAARGQNTDPQFNTALAGDLNAIDQQALEMRSKLEETLANEGQQMVAQANQLLNSGLNATQLAAQIPLMMQKLQIDLNSQTANALSTFAAALGGTSGGGKAVTLKLP